MKEKVVPVHQYSLTHRARDYQRNARRARERERALSPSDRGPEVSQDFSVLVLNESRDMAQEITLQLTINIPGCAIMYAPSVSLAQLMLRRGGIDLIVSSPVLPDGTIEKLNPVLGKMHNPPDVIVVGRMEVAEAEGLSEVGYDLLATKAMVHGGGEGSSPSRESIAALGADLRNDLNNPLQAITAMVFVARSAGSGEPVEQALEAINTAAVNMAKVVKRIESRIADVVSS